jgi:TonB-linked SusC/RagA family outer membrane protein
LFPKGKEPLSIKGSLPNQMKLRVIFVFLFSLFSSFIFAQRTVTGQVTSGDTALAGVTVQVKGTQATTQTDADGKFSISASPNATLVFSFVGYGIVEEKLGNRTFLPVQLQSTSQQLGEVVVVGYGTQRKRDITGAVSTVKAADLNQTNAVSIDNLLQGRAAGLNVATNTAQPGGAVNINIRGAISPRGDNSPLYVIDGLPITTNASTELNSVTGNFRGGFSRSPLDNINPNDIESVDILKDASATAIYGSAAANGVILITTKRGKEGRAIVNYSGTYSIQNRKKYLETLNAVEFRNSVNTYGLEFFKFNNRLAPYGNGTTPLTNYRPYFTEAQIAETNLGMNYIDYVLRQGRMNDHNISISSGNANTKIFTSFNYYNQLGLLRNSDFSRYSTRVNLDQRLSSVVSFNLGLSYSQVNSNNVPTGQSGDIDSPSLLQSALQFAPDIRPFDSTGKPNPSYYARTPNPASFFQILNKNFSRRFIATPNLQINIAKGLKVNITGGIDNTNTDRQFFIPVAANFSTVPQGNAQMGLTKLNNYSSEAYVTYDKAFTNSRLSAVAGVGYYSSAFSDFGLNAVGFSTDVFGVNNIGIAYNRAQSSQSSNRTARNKLSQFTRLNYTLMDKYIFQFTGRFDGTSNFPQNNLFGFFPGVSAGWVMTEENFLKDTRWLNQLKLRAGYGTSGNESITTSGNYVYSLYSLSSAYNYLIGNQLYNTGFFQTQLGNQDLKWETDCYL